MTQLAGLRVLVVEDEALIASLLGTVLEQEGCGLIGPFARLAPAMECLKRERIDCALLDVNLAGEKVFPLAEALEASGIPFLLLTGDGESGRPADRPHWRTVSKPFRMATMLREIAAVLAPERSG